VVLAQSGVGNVFVYFVFVTMERFYVFSHGSLCYLITLP